MPKFQGPRQKIQMEPVTLVWVAWGRRGLVLSQPPQGLHFALDAIKEFVPDRSGHGFDNTLSLPRNLLPEGGHALAWILPARPLELLWKNIPARMCHRLPGTTVIRFYNDGVL